MLSKLVSEKTLITQGKGKSTTYLISPLYELLIPIALNLYYTKEIDDRDIKKHFNFEIINDILGHESVFADQELEKLEQLHQTYTSNISQLSENEYKKELERLAIDLSWKSSQIEGNTYSLLETKKLLKQKETASGKTKKGAVMLLNHKEALDLIIEAPDYLTPLTLSKIEDIHSILIQELRVEKNIRSRRVGISGTNYRPLNNQFQIKEALKNACEIINNKNNTLEKGLLALVFISYIQPFMDGNKRTSKIVSNAIPMSKGYCPLSFRTIDPLDYKKATLLFYEQNNISSFKQIFMNQYKFAVNTYF